MSKKTIVAITLTAFLFTIGAVSASSYEWITDLAWHTSSGSCCRSEQNVTFTWRTNTNSSYDEYRSLYYTTTTLGEMPTSTTNWVEWQTCRIHGTVNPYLDDKCAVTLPTYVWSAVSSTLWVRATTNYAGCGATYTATPDTINCGDFKEVSNPFTP